MNTQNLGLDLVVFGSTITVIGVLVLNLSHDYRTATTLWLLSNGIFIIYFYGREKDLWDGGLSDTVMKWMYVVMLVSGICGLVI